MGESEDHVGRGGATALVAPRVDGGPDQHSYRQMVNEQSIVRGRMDPAEIRRRASEIAWWHTMDIGHGIVTPGRDQTQEKLRWLHLPDRLDGLSVLDVGASDGAFSFEAERRGAARVLAVDPLWNHPSTPDSKRGFELARESLGSSVESATINIHELDPSRVGEFDLVLCLGVLYHLRNPFGGLQRLASVTGDRLILETEGDLLDIRRPAAAFYPGDELNADPSNWWGVNRAGLIAMMKAVDFREVEIVFCPTPARRLARAARDRFRKGIGINAGRGRGRVVVHALR